MSQQTDWDAVGYIISSKYRTRVIKQLSDGPKMPSAIAEQYEQSMAHYSRAITDLREEGYTKLLVDEDTKKGRLYALTDKAEEIVEPVKKQA